MERFIKVTKAKLVVMCLSSILPILVITVLPPMLNEHFKVYADIKALRYVIFALVEGVIIFKIIRYIRILKDSNYRNSAYVKLHDERLVFVKMKSCAMSIKIILYVLSIFTVAFGFVNASIFYTLLAVLGLVIVVMVSTSFYYHKKY